MKKKNNVTPVHIKDSTQQTENHRPISLLSIIRKDLERRVSVLNFMNNHVKQFISPLQHGFLRNRFCTTQLLSANAFSQNLDKNIQTEVISWTWLRLSIPLITKLCFKSSNDMVRKAARFFGLQIT